MEEEKNTQEAPEQTAATPDTTEQKPDAEKGKEDGTVTLSVTVNGETTSKPVRFNTPALLEQVKALDDSATVKVDVIDSNVQDGKRTLLEGTKEEAVKALSASVIPADKIAAHLQSFMKTILDHSTMKAVAVSAVCTDDQGRDAGFGFVHTSADCTASAAVALVNCSDANMDEFITKAKLDVPGRNGSACKGVITPTAEEVKELG